MEKWKTCGIYTMFEMQGSYTFDLLKFHDFFHDLLKNFMT